MQTPFELLVVAVNHSFDMHREGLKPDKKLHDLTIKLLERVNKDLYADNTYELSTGVEARMEDLEEYISDTLDVDVDEDKEKDDVEEIDYSEEEESDKDS